MTADEEYDQWLARLRRDEILATYQHRVFEAELAPERYKPGGYGRLPRPESLAGDRKPRRRRPYEFTDRQMQIAVDVQARIEAAA
jgi:hypothetical protein